MVNTDTKLSQTQLSWGQNLHELSTKHLIKLMFCVHFLSGSDLQLPERNPLLWGIKMANLNFAHSFGFLN